MHLDRMPSEYLCLKMIQAHPKGNSYKVPYVLFSLGMPWNNPEWGGGVAGEKDVFVVWMDSNMQECIGE